jgi:hypothetical protein
MEISPFDTVTFRPAAPRGPAARTCAPSAPRPYREFHRREVPRDPYVGKNTYVANL